MNIKLRDWQKEAATKCLKWYTQNIKKSDIHNLLYIQKKLIGYTLLRKRSYKAGNQNFEKKYLLFDTLIIDKLYRSISQYNSDTILVEI